MTSDFIDQLLTEYNSRHGIKMEGKIIWLHGQIHKN
jgi:hypothetical protein